VTERQTGGQTQGYGIYRASTSSRDKKLIKKEKKLYAQQSNKRDQIEHSNCRSDHVGRVIWVYRTVQEGESGCKSYISDDHARTMRSTIRDAILTCARKPAWVSLIYRTEPTTKMCENRKTISRKQICSEITVNSLGNPCSESWKAKGRTVVGRICRKGRF